ncbi:MULTISPECIES: hypothetical protein [unclassified Streptomyces]|uniref:hypothetical protein n=1 Tax=unclassified Streptomyces TaxID=2593676 RepID=UPI00380166EA
MLKSLISGLSLVSGMARSAVSLVIEAASSATAEPVPVPEPTGLYEADEMPPVEDIEAAAAEYERSADQARRADRGKRAARKVLDRLPAGRYGSWLVSRVTSNRQTADLDEIRRIFKAHRLGPVPMKSSVASLKVERLASVEADVTLVAA